MKTAHTAIRPRPRRPSTLVARTQKEAAVQLVRLEFDRSRVERGIAMAEERAAAYRVEAKQIDRQRQVLLSIIVGS